jgi:L-ribulokinase
MSIVVAGADFGTLNVRVSIFDNAKGRLGAATAEYPLHRQKNDPDYATESHQDQVNALCSAMRQAIQNANVEGSEIEALAIDTTGSSVIPVDERMQPLGEYYLWCDHRAWREAAEITRKANETGLKAIEWCGGVYSSEWGFSKLLHWLRHNPDKRERFASAFENCDYIAAVLCGIDYPSNAKRSICAMGHKWMWNESLGGLPPEEFLVSVDPLFAGVREKLSGEYAKSDTLAGTLAPEWAERLGLHTGVVIPVGAYDAHWDAIGAGVQLGDMVNVIGTSTCIIGLSDTETLVPGLCGIVPGSVDPKFIGIEAGLSAVGDIFDAIARRAGSSVGELSKEIAGYRAGQTGLLRFTWDNGDRTVLVNPELGGITLNWHLTNTAADELLAAIEGTALHTRVILERMEEHKVPIKRVINGGGIPKKNDLLNQIYANALNKPILVPQGDVTSLGSAIFAFLACGVYATIAEAQQALCPPFKTYEPQPSETAVYEKLYRMYKKLYFGFGERQSKAVELGAILPELRRIAAETRH